MSARRPSIAWPEDHGGSARHGRHRLAVGFCRHRVEIERSIRRTRSDAAGRPVVLAIWTGSETTPQLSPVQLALVRGLTAEHIVHRYYDPATGQFLTVDPDVQQTQEPYVYAGDNPTDSSDPGGQDAAPCAGVWSSSSSSTSTNATLTADNKSVPGVLYHYTTVAFMYSIVEDGHIDKSTGSGRRAIHGQGVYMTDNPPWVAATGSAANMARALFSNPRQAWKVKAYVAIRVAGLNGVRWTDPVYPQDSYPPDYYSNYYRPGDMNVKGRVVSYGRVAYGSSYEII